MEDKASGLRAMVADFIRSMGTKQKKKKAAAGKKSGPMGKEVGRGLDSIIRNRKVGG